MRSHPSYHHFLPQVNSFHNIPPILDPPFSSEKKDTRSSKSAEHPARRQTIRENVVYVTVSCSSFLSPPKRKKGFPRERHSAIGQSLHLHGTRRNVLVDFGRMLLCFAVLLLLFTLKAGIPEPAGSSMGRVKPVTRDAGTIVDTKCCSGHRPRQGTEISNFGEFSRLDFFFSSGFHSIFPGFPCTLVSVGPELYL